MTESEAVEKLKNMRLFMQIEDKSNDFKFAEDDYKANEMAIQALEKQIPKKPMWNRRVTAYDVDKVVNQLEKNKFIDCETVLSDVHQGYNAGLSRAIDIVKAGGKNDD